MPYGQFSKWEIIENAQYSNIFIQESVNFNSFSPEAIGFYVFRPLSGKHKENYLCVLRVSAVNISLQQINYPTNPFQGEIQR
jgi:hypothetical protein